MMSDSNFNTISQFEKKADFFYTVEKYICDAEKDSKSQLTDLWYTIKHDKQKHLLMLKEAQRDKAAEFYLYIINNFSVTYRFANI